MGRMTVIKVNKLLLSSRDDGDETAWEDDVAATEAGDGVGDGDDMISTRVVDGWWRRQ